MYYKRKLDALRQGGGRGLGLEMSCMLALQKGRSKNGRRQRGPGVARRLIRFDSRKGSTCDGAANKGSRRVAATWRRKANLNSRRRGRNFRLKELCSPGRVR